MLIILSGAQHAHSWSGYGHQIVAHVAEHYLSPAAQKKIAKIDGKRSLAELATLPDDIRDHKRWKHSGPWHYINIDDDENWNTVKRSTKGDILSALEFNQDIVVHGKPSLSIQKRSPSFKKNPSKKYALAFLVHFIGDLHQPLHVGYLDDRGGNTVNVRWFDDEKTSLHGVWDYYLVAYDKNGKRWLSPEDYSAMLVEKFSDSARQWEKGDFTLWTSESKSLRHHAYPDGNRQLRKLSLGVNYLEENQPLVYKQLFKAGVRTAAVLNRIFHNE